jgi:hypothetical protein
MNYEELQEKVKQMQAGGTVDLSRDEDLSLAVMNLLSLEEHMFFTAEKTGKPEYLEILKTTRELRKELMVKLTGQHEGETWCSMKHMLSASMRLMEVGTKLQGEGKTVEAKDFFDKAYKVYATFWGLRLKLLETKDLKKEIPTGDAPMSVEDLVSKLVDCCKE